MNWAPRGPGLGAEARGPDNSPKMRQRENSTEPGTKERRKHTMIPREGDGGSRRVTASASRTARAGGGTGAADPRTEDR